MNATRFEYHLIQRSPAASLSKIGIASWLAGNAGVTDRGLLSASFNNPGAMRIETWNAAAELTYRAKARYLDLLDYDDILYPSFASVGYGDKQMSVAITYARHYSQYLELDEIEITTVEQPEGTGELVAITENVDVYSLAATLQYSLMENIGIGGTLGANYLVNRDEIWKTYSSVQGWSLLLIAGVHAAFDEVSIGASMRYSSPFSLGNVETNAQRLRLIDPLRSVEVTTKYFARLPIVYQAGISVQALSFLRISINEEIQNWNFVHSSYDNVSNFHIGIVVSLIDGIDLLLGRSEQFDSQSEQTDQIFLSSGICARIEHFTLVMGISDSKMLSPERRGPFNSLPKEQFRQTHLMCGLTYSF